ncbi:hypothetical protein ACEN88_00475 [Massilia sp. CT11-108]|uniref:terminase small subunit-like protein n=1 Tax=Massilia sp. CT11-108 TaxID=3393900 RepID=UPI0039A65B58
MGRKTQPKTELTAREKMDAFGIDAVCAAILHPKAMHAIADEIGVSQGSLVAWIGADSERSARAREARVQTAQMWDEKATLTIETAGDQFELSKARELAQHYRWRASKIAPRDYGDKVAIGGAADLPPVKAESMLDVSSLSTAALIEIMRIKDATEPR